MNFKKTLLLVAVALFFGLYLNYVEMPRQISLKNKGKIFSAEGNKISSITISRTGGDTELIEKDSNWILSSLPNALLEKSIITQLVNGVKELDLGEPLPADELEKDLSVYGLLNPSFSLKVKDSNGEKIVKFGSKNEYTQKRYIKLAESESIFALPDVLYASANKTIDDFRDKTPVEFSDEGIGQISISNNALKSKLLLNKVTADASAVGEQWTLSAPITTKGRLQAVTELKAALRRLKADGFVDNQDAKTGLDTPKVVVELGYADKKYTISFSHPIEKNEEAVANTEGSEKNKEYDYYFQISGNPSVYRSNLDPASFIVTEYALYRENKLAVFDIAKVQKLEISGSKVDSAISVKRKNSIEWDVNGKEGDNTFIVGYLRGISDMMAVNFVENEAEETFGFDKPILEYSITMLTGDPLKIIIGNEAKGDPKRYYAKVNNDVILIDEATFKRVTPKVESLLPVKAEEKKSEE